MRVINLYIGIVFLIGCFFTADIMAHQAGDSHFESQKNQGTLKFNRNNVQELIEFYSDQGDHRTGSTADKNTLSWMEKKLKNMGYRVTYQSFPFLYTTQSKAELTFKTLEYRTLEGMTLFNSEGTHSNELMTQFGETDQFDSVPVFHYFVMLPNENISPELIRNNHRELDAILSSNRYPAVIVITQGNKTGLAPFDINMHHHYSIPIILISSSFGNLLEMESKINKRVSIVAINKKIKSTSYNLIATWKGKNPDLKPLIMMVSRNAWWRASAERGTGVAGWLAIAKKISDIEPQRSLVMVALGGNELGHLGYHQFVREFHSLINAAYAWIYIGANIAGQPPSTLMIKTNKRPFYRMIENLLRENLLRENQLTDVTVTQISSQHGTPYISFSGRTNECYHLKCDKWPTTVSIDNEMLFVETLGNLVEHLTKK